MFVGYTAQFASEHNACAYVDFSCSQHRESVVSPIFVDNNNEHTHTHTRAGNKRATKKRRTINGRHQPSKGKEQTDEEKDDGRCSEIYGYLVYDLLFISTTEG